MLTKLEKIIDEQTENFNKELENIKNQSELKKKVTERVNTLESINSSLGDTKEHIGNLEGRIVELTQ